MSHARRIRLRDRSGHLWPRRGRGARRLVRGPAGPRTGRVRPACAAGRDGSSPASPRSPPGWPGPKRWRSWTPSPDRVEPPCPHARPGRLRRLRLAARHAARPAVAQGRRGPPAAQAAGRASTARSPSSRCPATRTPAPTASRRRAVPGLAAGLATRVQFAVRPDGVAGLRAHRSHEVIDIGECLIAHPGHHRPRPSPAGAGRARPRSRPWSRTGIGRAGRDHLGRPAGTRPGNHCDRAGSIEQARGPARSDSVLRRAGHRLTPRARPPLPEPAGGGTGLAGQRGRVLAGASRPRPTC